MRAKSKKQRFTFFNSENNRKDWRLPISRIENVKAIQNKLQKELKRISVKECFVTLKLDENFFSIPQFPRVNDTFTMRFIEQYWCANFPLLPTTIKKKVMSSHKNEQDVFNDAIKFTYLLFVVGDKENGLTEFKKTYDDIEEKHIDICINKEFIKNFENHIRKQNIILRRKKADLKIIDLGDIDKKVIEICKEEDHLKSERDYLKELKERRRSRIKKLEEKMKEKKEKKKKKKKVR